MDYKIGHLEMVGFESDAGSAEELTSAQQAYVDLLEATASDGPSREISKAALVRKSDGTVVFYNLDTVNSGDMTVSVEASKLSEREVDIMRCLVFGHSNKVIAHMLGITEATVKVHMKSLTRKIKVKNRTQAAIWGIDNGYRLEMPVPEELKAA